MLSPGMAENSTLTVGEGGRPQVSQNLIGRLSEKFEKNSNRTGGHWHKSGPKVEQGRPYSEI